MTTQWADYSAGRPSGAALKAAGFGGAIRYVGLGSSGKRITAGEYQDLVAAGVQVLLVAEYDTTDAWGGYAAGTANAQAALNDARACGIPDSVGIAAAADAHAANPGQIDAAVGYARGFQDVLGKARTGFYGFFETLNAVHAAGIGSWYWRCGAEPVGADRQWVNFWQRNAAPTVRVVAGIDCDINEQLNPPPNQGVPDVLLTDKIKTYSGQDTTVGDVLLSVYNEIVEKWETGVPADQRPPLAPGETPYKATARQYAVNADAYGYASARKLDALAASNAGLVAALAAATTNTAITPAFVQKTIQDAVAQHIQITGTVNIVPKV